MAWESLAPSTLIRLFRGALHVPMKRECKVLSRFPARRLALPIRQAREYSCC